MDIHFLQYAYDIVLEYCNTKKDKPEAMKGEVAPLLVETTVVPIFQTTSF